MAKIIIETPSILNSKSFKIELREDSNEVSQLISRAIELQIQQLQTDIETLSLISKEKKHAE